MEEKRADLALEPIPAAKTGERNAESFSVNDYVRELFLNSEDQKQTEKKKLRLLRAVVALLGAMCAVLLFSALLLVPKLINAVSLANQTLETLQTVDIASIAGDIEELTLQASETFETVGESAQVLSALDMDSLNNTITELKTGVESLNKIDVATLNKAIANLNATIEPFAKFFGKK